jgi:DNA-binding CsgD family transcriptional regulator
MESVKGFGTLRDQSVAELLQRWGEREATPRALLDDRLTILWANGPAQSELARRRDLEAREGVLATTDHSRQQVLRHFITSSGANVGSMCLACADGDGHLLFRCIEVSADSGNRYFGLVFFRSGSEFSVKYADLDNVFSLTHAEHRVLLKMLEGNTADEIAHKMGVSIETTRSHIRQIYLKLDVTSREGLFSRVRPYRV